MSLGSSYLGWLRYLYGGRLDRLSWLSCFLLGLLGMGNLLDGMDHGLGL